MLPFCSGTMGAVHLVVAPLNSSALVCSVLPPTWYTQSGLQECEGEESSMASSQGVW